MQHSIISTELIKAELLTQMNVDMDCQSFPELFKGNTELLLEQET